MATFKQLYLRKVFALVSIILLVSVILVLGVSSATWNKVSSDHYSLQFYDFEIVNEFPHDSTAFTQGLLYAGNDTLFEATGLYRQSSVRKVAIRTGKLEQFTHEMEDGWGLATDGKILYGSDGTSTLYQIDSQTLKVTTKNVIKFNGQNVRYLNELEYINGEIWANVWQTDCIARISPNNGTILGWILLPSLREGLLAAGYNGIDVLNGIAWDSGNNRIFVTGKLWPKLYEIKLHPAKKHYNSEDIEKLCLA
ncbi:hypothetical protein V6Z11_D08G114900 [Gossypium hirsutum]